MLLPYLLAVDDAGDVEGSLGTELLQGSLEGGALSRARSIGFL
jgi:hypothetical protein